MAKRLANVKTRSETGLDYVTQSINLQTPYGKKLIKDTVPFFPGEEELLKAELARVENLLILNEKSAKTVEIILELFMELKDATFTIERSKSNALSTVELFEVKSLLLSMLKLRETLIKCSYEIPQEFIPDDTEELLNVLDPGKDRINTFYIYDEFSEKLAMLRKEKRESEIALRKSQKIKKEAVKEKYGIVLTPKFDYVVSKSASAQIALAQEIEELERADEDYMSVTFILKKDETEFEIVKAIETCNEKLDEEETKVRENLSQIVSQYEDILLSNCQKIGKLDITLAKAIYACNHHCVKPEVVAEHIIEIEEGRHLHVEDVLIAKKKQYCPVSISLKNGVTCITGANMGGKTVSLKLVGLVAILTQYGFFVPCTRAKVGLSNYMQILIGDSQSVERGLSSFGSEMEELKEIFDNSKERSLLLVDEIASGTNPVEGLALTKSIVDYLMKKPYITLITTHFDSVTIGEGIVNMQVMGLAGADFVCLDRELRYANRKERINIIGRYMDYRLHLVENEKEIPKDALNIAKILGISDEIIEKAKLYIK